MRNTVRARLGTKVKAKIMKKGWLSFTFQTSNLKAWASRLTHYPLADYRVCVEANGQLEVPPQYEATVTAILGANVTSIKVIGGRSGEQRTGVGISLPPLT